jgi:hypothetical protein
MGVCGVVQVIMSPQAWARVKDYFEPKDVLHGGFVRVLVRGSAKSVRIQLWLLSVVLWLAAVQSCTKTIKKVGIVRIMKELNLDSVGPGACIVLCCIPPRCLIYHTRECG